MLPLIYLKWENNTYLLSQQTIFSRGTFRKWYLKDWGMFTGPPPLTFPVGYYGKFLYICRTQTQTKNCLLGISLSKSVKVHFCLSAHGPPRCEQQCCHCNTTIKHCHLFYRPLKFSYPHPLSAVEIPKHHHSLKYFFVSI